MYDRIIKSICLIAIGIFEHALIEYAGKQLVRVHNWADEGYWTKKWFWQQSIKVDLKQFPPEEIKRRAKQFLEEKNNQPYHLFKNNCEIFATTCRYGRGFSGQSIAFSWGLSGWFQ
jgi:hypothetical protein